MSDPFYDAESSVDASLPVELYTIVNQNTTWRHTSADRDVIWNNQLYTTTACDRSEVGLNIPKATFQLTLKLPCTHPLAVRWAACAGTPPRKVTATLVRLQQDAGVAEQFWQGEIGAMTIQKGVANFSVPSRFGKRLDRRMGTVSNMTQCPHTLYDSKCLISDAAFKFTTVVTFMSGSLIRVDMGDLSRIGSDWAVLGDCTHVASGESMTIMEQNDLNPTSGSTISDLVLHAQIYELKIGDQVVIRAGCDHDLATCIDKYANQANFGGFPSKPLRNPIIPTGLGVVVQE